MLSPLLLHLIHITGSSMRGMFVFPKTTDTKHIVVSRNDSCHSEPTSTKRNIMEKAPQKKLSPWFYVALVVQTLLIILVIGMLRDLMWIL